MANNADRDAEIAGLKAHIASLEQRLCALEPKPVAPPPSRERPVTVTYLTPVVSTDALPSDGELRSSSKSCWKNSRPSNRVVLRRTCIISSSAAPFIG